MSKHKEDVHKEEKVLEEIGRRGDGRGGYM